MLISWDVPTQKTEIKPKAFCSNHVLTGPHIQSQCVAKHSREDTSHVISTWPMRESRLSIQSDWLRSVHVTMGSEIMMQMQSSSKTDIQLVLVLEGWRQRFHIENSSGGGSTYREYMNPQSWRRPFWSTQTTPGITWLTVVFQAVFASMGPTLFSMFVKITLEWGFGHQSIWLTNEDPTPGFWAT